MSQLTGPALHHVVIAVAPERAVRTAALFTELGFEFAEFDMPDVGLHVRLDWTRGIELVNPLTDDPDDPVRRFLDRHGDGVYTIVIRVGDAPTAEQIARRYGATTEFRQHRDGDGWQLDEIQLTARGLPVTFLTTDLP